MSNNLLITAFDRPFLFLFLRIRFQATRGRADKHAFTHIPTYPFITLEFHNSSHDIPELLKIRGSPDLEVLKLWKGRSGSALLWRKIFLSFFSTPFRPGSILSRQDLSRERKKKKDARKVLETLSSILRRYLTMIQDELRFSTVSLPLNRSLMRFFGSSRDVLLNWAVVVVRQQASHFQNYFFFNIYAY